MFGVTSLGPWAGKLSSDGETVRLRDGAYDVVDEADYKVGFPWPVAADGSGSSIELINHFAAQRAGHFLARIGRLPDARPAQQCLLGKCPTKYP